MSRLRILTKELSANLEIAKENLSSLKTTFTLQKEYDVKVKYFREALSKEIQGMQGMNKITNEGKNLIEYVALFKGGQVQNFKISEALEIYNQTIKNDQEKILDQMINKEVDISQMTYMVKADIDVHKGKYHITFYYNDFPQVKKILMSKIKTDAHSLINSMVGKKESK